MLRAIDRLIQTRSSLNRNALVRRALYSAISHATGDVSTGRVPALVHVLQRLESTLNATSGVNVDEILKNLHSLHSMQTVIPLSYFLDAANILSAKNDATRLELLIHICRDNVHGGVEKVDKKASQSRPSDDPLDKLVSTAISGLFRCGNKDDASKLWIRMSNSGYVTSRKSIELLIDQIASSPDYSPSLQLLTSLHGAMKAHLWHQNPQYYAKTLNMIRRYIILDGGLSRESLINGVAALERMWLDANEVLIVSPATQQLPVELHALRLHCYAAAMQASQRGDLAQELTAQYGDKASTAYEELLERSVTDRGVAVDNATVATLADMIKQILSVHKSDANAPADLTNSRSASIWTDSSSTPGHFSLYSILGDTRRSSRLFLKQLANQGHPLQAVDLLRRYIENHSSSSGHAVVNGTAPTATQLSGAGFVDGPEAFRSGVTTDKSSTDLDACRAAVVAALADRSLFGANVALNGPSGLYPPREAANKQYSAEEKVWQGDTVCEILRNTNVTLPLVSHFDPAESVSFDYRVFKDLEEVFLTMKNMLHHYQLKPGPKFYASFIDALSHNMKYLSDHPARSSDISIPWQSSLAVARTLLDGVDPRIADSAEVYHSLIHLLCQGSRNPDPDPKAVLRALELIHDKGDEKHLILPATLATVLEAATASLDDLLLSRVLIELEHLLYNASVASPPTGPSAAKNTAVVLSARIHAHCRLREGYRAVGLMRALRELRVKLPRSLYLSIVTSLYHSQPISQKAKDASADPTATIEFLVKEMQRDKYTIDSHMVSQFLRLYTKAVQSAVDADRVLATMSKFVKQCHNRKGVLGPKEIVVDSHIVRELVKAHCLAGNMVLAKEIAEQCEITYGVKSSADVFEPIIFKLAALDGQIAEAEGLILELLNKGLLVTPAIVGSIVIGHLQHKKDNRDALDCVQDMHNLHGVCPSPTVWTMLLDASLSSGDVMEAQRVVSFLRQLHTAEERELLVGARTETLDGAAADDSEAARKSAVFVDKLRVEDVERQEAIFSYWNPLAYFKLASSPKPDDSGTDSGTLVADKPARRVAIRQNVPVGHRERGVLSDSALKKRFLRFGYSLK